ncbi:hypothetical protein PU629_04495 [Pullulanibacillus sp. KACC 23026]|uniref:hypothetical protein n=1 Tax=Pullulanibacillus sp. KACC 23026 TaxID=3028315 RepID=UPI0023AFE529|nr:hypothetical protein [Pullulanibacillus sp. KACC 23026]WEG13633.1 hypothetical protein PU629_04495 [Pullulanibacillus sp. KACC 23026]
MLKKSLMAVCVIAVIGVAFVLAKTAPPKTSHAGDNEITFYSVGLHQPDERLKIDGALHNLIGIDQVTYHPDKDAVTVTFDYDTMRAKWIEKALESSGIPFKLRP